MCKRSVKKSKWKATLRQQKKEVKQEQSSGHDIKPYVIGSHRPCRDFK